LKEAKWENQGASEVHQGEHHKATQEEIEHQASDLNHSFKIAEYCMHTPYTWTDQHTNWQICCVQL